jgi:hypothetical protein
VCNLSGTTGQIDGDILNAQRVVRCSRMLRVQNISRGNIKWGNQNRRSIFGGEVLAAVANLIKIGNPALNIKSLSTGCWFARMQRVMVWVSAMHVANNCSMKGSKTHDGN